MSRRSPRTAAAVAVAAVPPLLPPVAGASDVDTDTADPTMTAIITRTTDAETVTRNKDAVGDGDDEEDEGEEESLIVRSVRVAVLDVLASRIEEEEESTEGREHEHEEEEEYRLTHAAEEAVHAVGSDQPWLTSAMLLRHLSERKRKRRRGQVEKAVKVKEDGICPSCGRGVDAADDGDASGTTRRAKSPKKRRRGKRHRVGRDGHDDEDEEEEASGTAKAKRRKRGRSSGKAAPRPPRRGRPLGRRKNATASASAGEEEGEVSSSRGEASRASKSTPAAATATDDNDGGTAGPSGGSDDRRRDEDGDTPSQPSPKRPRTKGGRPKGTTLSAGKCQKSRPRGSYALQSYADKFDQSRVRLARDHATLEYHAYIHRLTREGRHSPGRGRNRGMCAENTQRLDTLIAEAKRRYAVPEEVEIKRSSIKTRMRRGNLAPGGRGVRSPMEAVEEELIQLANAKLEDMDRQLTPSEGIELANGLVAKYGMESELIEWKKKHTYVKLDDDGNVVDPESVGRMTVKYWEAFTRRHGHRLLVRTKLQRGGPKTPLVQIEPLLVDALNDLGRPCGPAEFVRIAISMVEGTEGLEEEVRSFKLTTLKMKSDRGKGGELLGPGYYRSFLRRNGHLLQHKK